MKKLFIFSILLYICISLYSQTPQWQWAIRGGGSESDIGYCTAVDEEGNVYLAGEFTGTTTYGTTTMISRGWTDIYVAKINANHEWLWVRQAGGTSEDRIFGMVLDPEGNVYVTGSYAETAQFSTTYITSYGNRDVFVAKLNGEGYLQWVTHAGGSHDDVGNSIAIDDSSNVYVTGFYYEEAVFGTHSLSGFGSYDIFVAKLDTSGTWLWVDGAGSSSGDKGNGIAVDHEGNSFVTGYFDGTAVFGPYSLTSYGSYDIFIAKLNRDGFLLGVFKAGGLGVDTGKAVALDEAGNLYFTGSYEESIAFGPFILTSQGGYDTFIAKMNSGAIYQWARSAGGIGNDQPYGFCADHVGNTYVTGYFAGLSTFANITLNSWGTADAYIAKLDANGYLGWAINVGGDQVDIGMAISTDNQGYVYTTGMFSNSISFDNTTLTSVGGADTYLAKLYSGPVANEDITFSVNTVSSLLFPIYPNPLYLGETATIKASIIEGDKGILSIYNLKGQKIAEYSLSAGQHQISHDSSGLASGIYFCKLKTQTVEIVKKLVLYR